MRRIRKKVEVIRIYVRRQELVTTQIKEVQRKEK